MKKLLWLVIAAYLVMAIINTTTTYESIDERSMAYWSSRLASHGMSLSKGLMMEPEMDRLMGALGFVRSGHFIYNRTLDQIAAGDTYHITPMVHFVPLLAYALPQLLLGSHAFFFVHIVFLILGAALPWWYLRRLDPEAGANSLGILVLLSPALIINATYVMTDVFGYLALSVFCYLIFTSSRQKLGMARLALLSSSMVALVFYKPIGWVCLPWAGTLLILARGWNLGRKIVVLTLTGLLIGGVVYCSQNIYGNPMWAGYHAPLNHFLKGEVKLNIEEGMSLGLEKEVAIVISRIPFTSLQDFREKITTSFSASSSSESRISDTQIDRIMEWGQSKLAVRDGRSGVFNNKLTPETNVLYGPPTLLLAYPLMLFLLIYIVRDLWQEVGHLRQKSFKYLSESDFLFKLVYLSLFFFLLMFFIFYNHSTPLLSYLSLSNPTFRYFLPAFISLVWYVVAFRLPLPLPRLFKPLAVASILIMIILPNNILERVAFRFYAAALQHDLREAVPSNAILMGAYRFDKYFPVERVPSYAFLGHRLHERFQGGFSDPAYLPTLGEFSGLLARIYQKGFVPVVIYPDACLPDTNAVENPYGGLQMEPLATIDVSRHFGWLGRFLPDGLKTYHLARIKALEAASPAATGNTP
jgi:hypothetical protein